jgi:hypothetical protein
MIRYKKKYCPLFWVALIFITFIGCKDAPEEIKFSKDIFQKYKDEGKGTYFQIPPGMVSVFLDQEKPGNLELIDLLSDVKKLTFLIVPNNTQSKESSHYSDINNMLEAIYFQDLASINNGTELITVKILPKGSVNTEEMIVLVSNYQSLFCISFQGIIDLSKIANLTKPENIEVISNLNRFNR